MSTNHNKSELNIALKIGLVSGISVAVIELYYLLVGLGSSGMIGSIYQTLWLLTAFIFAMTGVWAARSIPRSLKSIQDTAIYSGVAGAVVGIFYVISVNIVEFISIVYDNVRYSFNYFNLSTFIGDVIGAVLTSLLWLPVVIAVAIFGGVVYATLAAKADGKKDAEEKPIPALQ